MTRRKFTVGAAFLLAVTVGMLLFAATPAAAATSGECTINGSSETYSSISNAVDNAEPGDTVECTGGFSEEQVTINDESLTLKGQDALLTGKGNNGTGILIQADDVTVEGFAVREYTYAGIDIGAGQSVDGVTIRNTSVNYSQHGIHVFGATGETVSNVTINNTVVDGSGQNGIAVNASSNGQVSGVNITNSYVNDSGTSGILVAAVTTTSGGSVSDVTIQNVLLEDNHYGARIEAGEASETSGITVTEVAAVENDRKGIYLRSAGTGADLNSVTVNRSLINGTTQALDENGDPVPSAAVYVHAIWGGSMSDVTVEENAIVDNAIPGIEVDETSGDLTGETVQRNYIGNNTMGVNNVGDEVFDARLNYWGHSSGPASPGSTPLKDPVASVFADGQGDTVSQGSDVDGYAASNVRFAPAIGGKTTCEDTPIHEGDQLIDLVPNQDVQDQLGTDFEVNTEVQGHSIDGPLTDFVGVCLWERSILPFRADDSVAATKIQGPDMGIQSNGVRAPLNRDVLSVYDQNQDVPFQWDTDVTGTADQDMFANEDAQFIVAKVTGNGTANMSLQTDAESGDVTFDSSELEVVEIQDTSLDGTADLNDPVAYTTADGDGVFVAMLVTDKTGDGFTNLEEGARFNVHESDLTIIGLDAIAVQTTASDVTPQYQTADLGEDIWFDIDANLDRSTGVAHGLILYDKETMGDTQVTITDWDFEFNATNETASGNVTVEVTDPDGNTETVTMNATDLVLEGGMLTGTLRQDGNETTIENETDLISGQLLIVGDPPVVDGNATNATAGDEVNLTLGTHEHWNPATYQYAHVAATDDGNFSTNWGTIELVAPENDASDIRVTGGKLSDDEIEEGDTVDVQGTVQNFGSDAGTHTIHLKVDGEVQASQDVSVEAEGLEYVEFTTEEFDEAGEYEIALNHLTLGTVTVAESDDTTAPPGGGLPPGGGAPPVSEPDVPKVVTPAPDNIVIDVPPGFLSFDLDIPATAAQEEAGVRVTRLAAQSRVSTGVNVNVDSARQPPGDVPALNAGRAGHLYLDITYDTDSSNWRSATFEWQASKARFSDSDPEDFTLYRYDPDTDEWETIETEFVGETDEAFQFRSESDGFSVYAVGTTQEGPDIRVTDATLSATQIQAGDSVDVQAVVENQGDQAGEVTVELIVDGDVVANQQVTLDAGASETVSFTLRFDDTGSFAISVNDVSAGTLDVTEAAEQPGGDDGVPGVLLGLLLVMLILVVAGGGYYYYLQQPEAERPF